MKTLLKLIGFVGTVAILILVPAAVPLWKILTIAALLVITQVAAFEEGMLTQ